MKKKGEGKIEYFSPVKLFKSDIEDIVQALQSCSTITLADKEYEYDSLDEIQKRQGSRVSQLNITSSDPYITLTISKKETRMYFRDDAKSLGPSSQIKNILTNRKKKGLAFFFNPIIYLLIYVFLIGGLYYAHVLSMDSLMPVAIVFLVGMAFLLMAYRVGAFSTIVLVNRHEEKSFWSRNRDEIIIIAISNLITALLSSGVAYLVFKRGLK